jgi:CAAX prenyl protease-like protein
MRMRDLAERITRFRPLQTALYWLQFIIVASVLTFPLTVYEGYFREHKYGLLNQTFGPWMRDQLIALAVSLILGGILLVSLVGLVRHFGKSWWVWSGGNHPLSGVRHPYLSGLHRSVIQQSHKVARCPHQRSNP